jgi:hypothetical protein
MNESVKDKGNKSRSEGKKKKTRRKTKKNEPSYWNRTHFFGLVREVNGGELGGVDEDGARVAEAAAGFNERHERAEGGLLFEHDVRGQRRAQPLLDQRQHLIERSSERGVIFK